MPFYYYNDLIFNSKIEAIQSCKNNLFYDYHGNIFDQIQWHSEPETKIADLYSLNALRLREKYDYLILCFSGGYDSTQILETFVHNNIKLDKIITVGAFSKDADSNSDENMNIEAYKNAFTLIEKYNLSSIYETFDYTKWFENPANFSLFEYGEKWVDEMGSLFSPHHFFWRDLEEIIIPNSWKDKKTGIIFGIEKPYLFYEKPNLYFSFKDSLVNQYGNRYHSEFSDRVFFFWDPTFPDILKKQLHLLKKAVFLQHKLSRKPIEECIDIINNLVNTPVLSSGHNLSPVYNIENALKVKSPKSSNIYLSNRDKFFFNCKNTEMFDLYSIGIKSIKTRLDTFQLPVIYSKKYIIGNRNEIVY
jgi:hypothetical protein